MEYEYEGKTEREAIEKAAAELGLEKDQFDVEILEAQKGTLFKKGFVRIRVSTTATPAVKEEAEAQEPKRSRGTFGRERGAVRADDDGRAFGKSRPLSNPAPQDGFEKAVSDFVQGMITRMGYEAKVTVLFREDKKIGFKIVCSSSAVIIGRKGATLDALQLLANVYAGRLGREDVRIILDTENYRIHREEILVRLAYNTADKVAASRRSVLLEPMNPFERRIIHTTLGDVPNIETKSEGDGVYKRVRVMWRGIR